MLILDINKPTEGLPAKIEYRRCNIGKWDELVSAFKHAGNIDIAVANAGISEETNYFADTFDENTGALQEPKYAVVDVNLKAVLNFVKLALSHFRSRECRGSIVITSSATAYSPEQSLPVYSACKLAVSEASPSPLQNNICKFTKSSDVCDLKLIGLVRALRSTVAADDITINTVAPAATITNLLPGELAAPIIQAGLPVSSSDFVGLAVVYSAVADQKRHVELYGKDAEELNSTPGRWNGRAILTLGDQYTELEEPIATLRPQWFGESNTKLTRMQQMASDFRT